MDADLLPTIVSRDFTERTHWHWEIISDSHLAFTRKLNISGFQNMPTTPSKAVLGYGATFSTGVTTGGTTAYTAVAEIATINFNGFTVPEVDVTHLQSPNSTNESIPGLLKPGTVDLTGNYTGDASQQTITTLGQARTVFPFQITTTLGDGSTYTLTGNGFVSKLAKGPFESDKKVDFSASIQCSGSFTETVTPAA